MNIDYTYPTKAKKKIKLAKEKGSTVYIYGMTGFGKTAFVKQYFNRKKHLYIDGETIAIEEFRKKIKKSKKSGEKLTVVVDNLQFADDIFVREYILELIQKSDYWLILVSRSSCPQWLVSYRFKGAGFMEISQDDLSLCENEIEAHFEKNEIKYEKDDIKKITEATRGHGMGLNILVKTLKAETTTNNIADYLDDCILKTTTYLWDYIENEIYGRWEPWFLEIVMRLSIVESFDKDLAEYITGNSSIELFFQKAMEIGNFLKIVDGKYVMEIEVRRSVGRRMERIYTKQQIEELYYNAGRYYRQQGEIVKALDMFKACNNNGQIYDILEEVARLNPGVNRMYELREYFFGMPDSSIRKSIDVMSGMSMLYAITLNYEKSDYWYEELVKMEKTAPSNQKKYIKSTIVYLDIALPHKGNSDMISLLKNASMGASSRKINLREFCVTGNAPSNMNGGKDFCEWSKKDKFLAKSIGKIVSFVLEKHGAGLVDLALAESFFEKGKDDYEVIRRISKGLMQVESGKIEECFVGEGLMSRLHLHKGNIEDSKDILLAFKQKCFDEKAYHLIPNLNNCICTLDLYAGNSSEYLKWMKTEAPDEFNDFFSMERYRYLTKVRIYLIQGKYENAQSLLERLLYFAGKCDRYYLEMECLLLLAILQYRLGIDVWQDTLQSMYSKAEDYHFVRLISAEAGAALELFEKAELEIKNKSFYNQVMSETKKMAKNYFNYLKQTTQVEGMSQNALQVLRYQAQGLSNTEIADKMSISVSTVKYHCKENYNKLGVSTKAAAVAEAQRRKII